VFDRIDPRSPVPIYAQIAARVRLAVASGELVAGDSLPSVRTLATRLRVNPATVAQAYRELEGERVVEMRQGSGTFVADVAIEKRARTRAVEAKRLVRELLESAARIGIDRDELASAFTSAMGNHRS
jgi:GntR family transcriptional regulator